MKPPSTSIPVSIKQSDDGSFENGTSSYMEEKYDHLDMWCAFLYRAVGVLFV